MTTDTAFANPNIAFIKYWGNFDATLRIPANGSISMNLDGLETRTTVTFDASLRQDQLTLNGQPASEEALRRVSLLLERVRSIAGMELCASVESQNNFPTGAGIASSASAFAALSLAASAAAGLKLSERECSRLARTGSGSACRSVPGGFVEWQAGTDDESSFAYSLVTAEHWDLVDCVAVVSQVHKPTGSTQGHALAESSPLQEARVASAAERLKDCREAIRQRDFAALATVAELDCNLMHAVMMTSQPPLLYWQPATLAVMHAVQRWRAAGFKVFYTIDAGPNVHVLCPAETSLEVTGRLRQIEGVKEVLSAHPGGPARLV